MTWPNLWARLLREVSYGCRDTTEVGIGVGLLLGTCGCADEQFLAYLPGRYAMPGEQVVDKCSCVRRFTSRCGGLQAICSML